MLQLPRSVYEAIRNHAEASYPHECCGALIGLVPATGWRIQAAVRAHNASTTPARHYSIAPLEVIAIERQARIAGMQIAGFYHSHPNHPAHWSSTDLEEAHWLGCLYVITSVQQGKAAATCAFLLTGESEEAKSFQPLEISLNDQLPETVA